MSKNAKLKRLKKLKSDYNNERKGYRYRQYEILANTMAIVIELRSDESALDDFLKLSGKKIAPTKAEGAGKWLTATAVAYVTGAKSESAVKLAWKRARVLDHLHDDHGIPPEEIADAIQSRGGLEAVASPAAKENPRRSKSAGSTKMGQKTSSSIKKNPFKSSKADKAKTGNHTDDPEPELELPSDDDDVANSEHSQVEISISPELKSKLMAFHLDKRVKLVGVRVEGDDWLDVVFEVQEVFEVQ